MADWAVLLKVTCAQAPCADIAMAKIASVTLT
jgi:hypothetical protein